MSSEADDRLIAAIEARDLRVAARLISRAEAGDPAIRPLFAALYARGGRARVVGLTGPPGAGKSTLADQLVAEWRAAGRTVAVLAVDPSSPFSGGAVLGDRLRMGRHDADAGVFIRSMAARGVLGGLARATGDALTLLDAMGWDMVLLETVGVGQNEIEVSQHAGCVVLLQTPVTGDAVQTAKAGVLETADLLVVNKADAEGSGKAVAALTEMLGRRADHGEADTWQPTVLPMVATTGTGTSDLMRLIDDRFAFLDQHPEAARALRIKQLRAQALGVARETLDLRMRQVSPTESNALLEQVLARKEDPHALSEALLRGDPA